MISSKFLLFAIFAAAFSLSMLFYAFYYTNHSERIEASNEAITSPFNKEKTVSVDESGFVPDTMIIRPGEQVRWVNKGAKNHRVTFRLGTSYENLTNLDEELASGDSVNFTFEKLGKYSYFDKLNPKFTGQVEVR